MKSNLFRKATALGVATAMVLSTTVFATQDVASLTANTKSEGTGTIMAPTYKIKVPGALSFAVDPYELGALATGSAINPRSAIKVPGYGYAISNQSNIAVSVTVDATLTTVPTANVYTVPLADINTNFTTVGALTSMGAATAVEVKDSTNLAKELSLYMLVASTGAIVPAGTATAGTVYTAEGAVEVNYASGASLNSGARATFLLDKGLVNPTTGAPTGVINTSPTAFGVFSFQGDVNSIAPWAANDVKVSVKYYFAPVSAANKDTIASGTPGYQPGMQAVISGTGLSCDNTPVTPEAPDFGTLTALSKGGMNTTTAIEITIADTGAGYKELLNTGTVAPTLKFVGASTLSLAAADLVFEDDMSKVSIKGTSTSKVKALADGNYSLELTAKNGRTVKGTITIGA